MRDLKRALADAMGVARDYRPDREAPAPAQEHSGEAEADNETNEYGATDEVPVRVSLPGGRELVVLCPRRLRVPDLRRRVAAAAKLPAPPRFLVDGGALLRHGHELRWAKRAAGAADAAGAAGAGSAAAGSVAGGGEGGFAGPGTAAPLMAFGGAGYHDDARLDQ